MAACGVGGQLAALGNPLVAAAVEQANIFVAEQGEDPERVGGPPVGLVAVDNHGGVARDALGRGEQGKSRAVNVVPGDVVVQVRVPVNLDRSRECGPVS